MNDWIIHNADCTQKMWDMEKDSIDLVVTSPPYDNMRQYNGDLEWSNAVWMAVFDHLKRILKPGGVIVWGVGDATIKGSETINSLRQIMYAVECCRFLWHDTMIYQKPGSGMPSRGAHRYGQSFEYMFVLSKGPISGHGQIERFPETGETGVTTRRGRDGICRKGVYNKGGGALPNVWRMTNKNMTNHPAVFPLELAERHIKLWSNPGDIVLDPFSGSGTTGVAAIKLGRKFIGIEIDEQYHAESVKRLTEMPEYLRQD